MPSYSKKFRKSYRKYKSWTKKYAIVKLDCGTAIVRDTSEVMGATIKFSGLESGVQGVPVRFVPLNYFFGNGRSGNESWKKIQSMWYYVRLYGVSLTVVPGTWNVKDVEETGERNNVVICFLPNHATGVEPTYNQILEQPGSRMLNPFLTTKLFYRTNFQGEWQDTLGNNIYPYTGIAIAPSTTENKAPQFTVKITMYFQCKNRKM